MAGGTQGAAGLVVDGRFELLRRLGRGGMGTVWQARDLALEREVALKEVRLPSGPQSGEESEELRERVLQEARSLARINHPHVVTVHHIVDAQPFPWIVMELLPGRTLATVHREGQVAPDQAAHWGLQVLSALRAVHAAGVLHRDVKPANVLLRADGDAVLTDFGIARTTDGPVTPARIVGSPEYLAPERIVGSGGDEASDLWSLGVLLYALTEGHPPFRRGLPEETLISVVEDPVPPPGRAGPLTPVLHRLLVKDPTARPGAEEVERLLSGVADTPATQDSEVPARLRQPAAAPLYPPPAPPPPPPGIQPHPPVVSDAAPPAPPRGRRGRTAAAIAGAVLLLGGLVTAVALWPDAEGESQASGDQVDDPRPDPEEVSDTERPETADPMPTAPAPPAIPDPEPDEDQSDPESDEADEAEADEAETDQDLPGAGDLNDMWIAQLFSEPVSSGTAARDQRLAAIRAEVPSAQVLRSDDYASLTPGYWVVYASGPFSDGREAVSYCADHGRTSGNECVGRYLSGSTAHRDLVCHPDDGGSGRCDA